MIQITSNRAKWVKGGQDTASVFRRKDVQASIQRSLARDIRQMTKAQFAGQGVGKSGAWAPLAASTVKRKGHAKILIDTGRLFRKATRGGSVTAGYIEAFKTFSFKYTIKTVPDGLITWIQKGTKRMPARPIIDPTDKQIEGFSDSMWRAIQTAWRRIGWADKIRRGRFTGFDRVDIG